MRYTLQYFCLARNIELRPIVPQFIHHDETGLQATLFINTLTQPNHRLKLRSNKHHQLSQKRDLLHTHFTNLFPPFSVTLSGYQRNAVKLCKGRNLMTPTYDVLVIGAGIFGTTAVSELNTRGYKTAVLDPGPIPHPLAASTDISKVVRMEYGNDEQYMAMVEAALPGWHRWNALFNDTLYHETGVTMFTRAPMASGGFEYESYQLLNKRGHRPERLNADEIALRFPAWKPDAFVDGFYHAKGGYAESGRVVSALLAHMQQQGTAVYSDQTVIKLIVKNDKIQGVRTTEGSTFHADQVIIAAGAWTHILLPELAPVMRASGHPVFHVQTAVSAKFSPPHFTVFTADISKSGWYGFPFHPTENVIKIANHGVGQQLHPTRDERVVTKSDILHFRAMLANTFPDLTDAPIVFTRRCLYNDTRDEHLWIDRHPTISGLTVAAGGSGHGFKFAPILGSLIADAMAGITNPWLPKFRWRLLSNEIIGEEASRFHG
jgi:glycine/D-amino acid oxidase-like deaminating enzyme